MIGAGMPFDARDLNRLTVSWMERVSNAHLDRQIPGSMSLLRREPDRHTFMLSHRLLKNHAGILLIGDYSSLRWLHEVVHDVNERSPIIKDKEGWFLGLAYDVRKAYEKQREILLPPEHFDEIGPRYGVQMLWPVLLLQERMLRVASAISTIPESTRRSLTLWKR